MLYATLTNSVDYISDLVPREAVEKWLKYLREELPAVAFKCSTQEQKSNLGWKSGKSGKSGKTKTLLQTSDCLGAETLIKLLKNYSRSHEVLSEVPFRACLYMDLSSLFLYVVNSFALFLLSGRLLSGHRSRNPSPWGLLACLMWVKVVLLIA